ncbi:tRNA-binding protein Pbp11 [Thermococcus sp.]
MGILSRLFNRGEEEGSEERIIEREPAGRFRVENCLILPVGRVVIGEVIDGVLYPGYKLKGEDGVAVVMGIEKEHRKVDFAIAGDLVGLFLDGDIECMEGDELEVYKV